MSTVIRKLICTSKSPKPIAPYNQAVLVDGTLYVSGIVPLNKDTMKIVDGGIVAQMKQVLMNLGYILEAGGSSFDRVVKTTVLLKNIEDFATINQIYQECFTSDFPARSVYEVSNLPIGALVEVEAIAVIGNVKTVSITVGECKSCGTNCTCK